MASYQVEICLKKKKLTPSTNIPLHSYRKSEQKGENKSVGLLPKTFNRSKTTQLTIFSSLLKIAGAQVTLQ